MAIPRGTRIGTYEIAGLLGTGGMGEVYRAHDTRLGRDVAIKILASRVAEDPVLLARIEREARLLASLNHPATVTDCDTSVRRAGASAPAWRRLKPSPSEGPTDLANPKSSTLIAPSGRM